MKKYLPPVIATLVVLALVGGALYWEISAWIECRETTSFWYCLRVLGR